MHHHSVDQNLILKEFNAGESIRGDQDRSSWKLSGLSIEELADLNQLLAVGSYFWVCVQLAICLGFEADLIEGEIGENAFFVVEVAGECASAAECHDCRFHY